ncbi:hypothetical protein J2T56_002658 [Natronobacillus azotifigens]|uniref:NETI motif-containing protein n=1 Tax=Natronobacillus azotifigens TaxID=472978 RepID=A0A9J6RFW3_9BACI|nr:NETI motif-containing protein [Natronobacillus azotifigens]MCZ0704309.1 NETI motif-containing protein [Natronobacillus azotifigens]
MEEKETIDECLERIKKAGYLPVRRTEKPIFQTTEKTGVNHVEPIAKQIIFDTVLAKDEH